MSTLTTCFVCLFVRARESLCEHGTESDMTDSARAITGLAEQAENLPALWPVNQCNYLNILLAIANYQLGK